jgi:hypothetical protein
MTTAEALFVGALLHFVGDYILQSDWMATEKTQKWVPAVAHATTYTLPFLLLTRNPIALLVIGGTHLIIDHYRLARHLVWVKNFLGPRRTWRPWAECSATGYPSDRPVWLTTWLLIIADNTVHILINTGTLWWLR